MEKIIDEVNKAQLVNDFKLMVADAEALIKATAEYSDDKVAEIRAKTEKSLKAAKARIAETQSVVLAKTKEAAKVTDLYVHENPWKSIGVAASIGLVVGMLIGRK